MCYPKHKSSVLLDFSLTGGMVLVPLANDNEYKYFFDQLQTAYLIKKVDHITCRIYTYRMNVIVLHCTDGLKNGDETGLDCGGSCEPCTGILINLH